MKTDGFSSGRVEWMIDLGMNWLGRLEEGEEGVGRRERERERGRR